MSPHQKGTGMRTKYDPAADHEPLIDVPQPQGGVRGPERKTYVRSVTRAMCPDCATDKPTGIIRQGEHLAWRHHTRTLGSGVRIECRAVGVPICQVEPRPVTGVTTPTCICGGPA